MEEQGQCKKSAAGRRRYALARPGSELEQNTFVLGRDVGLAESGVAALLGVHMDGPREEGFGSVPQRCYSSREFIALYYAR
jgi:hypothetical protein